MIEGKSIFDLSLMGMENKNISFLIKTGDTQDLGLIILNPSKADQLKKSCTNKY